MRVTSLGVVVVWMIWPFSISSQQVAPNSYTPPHLTLERLMHEDPSLNGAALWTLAADPVSFRSLLEKQAADGRLLAQMLLGEAYIPTECTFIPFKTAPADCPQDPAPQSLLGLTPSFDLAIHWLSLASEQGSGEASEVLAQVIERTIKSSIQSRYQMTDVAHYHAIARSQGFDLQDVELSCYTLDRTHASGRLAMADMPAEFQFTPQQLDALHAAGASGVLRWRSTSIQPGLTTLLQHPEGPKIHTRIVLSGPVSHEVTVPMADRVDVVYLQEGDRISTFPASYPALLRRLSFKPPTVNEGAGAKFQQIDGRLDGGCALPASP